MVQRFCLRALPPTFKAGLTGLLLTLLMGMAASAMHLYWHYENRDERPGLTPDDITSAYHGLNAPAPLLTALQRGHPEALAQPQRDALIKWLKGSRISEDYDSLDLGAAAPAEIIAQNCTQCHSRKSTTTDPRAKAISLDYFDDIKKAAFSRQINPVPAKVIAVSMHTHALSLGALSIVLAGLALATRLPRPLMNGLVAITGIALAADIASWWLARESAAFVAVIIGAGGLYNACTVLLIVLILIDLWLPAPRGSPE